MYEVNPGKRVYRKGTVYKEGETFDAPAEVMQELVDNGCVRFVEEPDAQTADESAPDVEQASLEAAKKQTMEAAEKKAPNPVKKMNASRKAARPKKDEEGVS